MLKKEIERLKLGEVILDENIDYHNENWLNMLSDVNHHMGGIRISKTPDEGVVDTNLKVWGISNLYVCSTAVFPTGSHSNPTVTMLALGLRLVDYLIVTTI
jgi:choline dehydrogenase-like flavoprotein